MNRADIKKIIQEILNEELLDEISGTGAASGGEGPPRTPHAFSSRKNSTDEQETEHMKKIAKHSMPDRESNIVDKHNPARVTEGRAKYYNFKESTDYKKNSAKVSFAIQEIKKMLKEVDYLATISNRLKTEADVSSNSYWKRTDRDLREINYFTKKISERIKGLR